MQKQQAAAGREGKVTFTVRERRKLLRALKQQAIANVCPHSVLAYRALEIDHEQYKQAQT